MDSSTQPTRHTVHSQLPDLSLVMVPRSQPPKEREDAISSLDAAIEATNLAEKISNIKLAKAVLGSVSVLLTTIRVCILPLYNDLLRVHMWPGLGGL